MNCENCANFKLRTKDWVRIDYDVIPKELFKKYGVKPFEIMEKKMRDKEGKVWTNMDYTDTIKECEKLGYRLPNIREMFLLLEHYKTVNKEISIYDKEFLGIKELSYNTSAYCEWVYFLPNVAAIRGGGWSGAAGVGVLHLGLSSAPLYTGSAFGFRCCK